MEGAVVLNLSDPAAGRAARGLRNAMLAGGSAIPSQRSFFEELASKPPTPVNLCASSAAFICVCAFLGKPVHGANFAAEEMLAACRVVDASALRDPPARAEEVLKEAWSRFESNGRYGLPRDARAARRRAPLLSRVITEDLLTVGFRQECAGPRNWERLVAFSEAMVWLHFSALASRSSTESDREDDDAVVRAISGEPLLSFPSAVMVLSGTAADGRLFQARAFPKDSSPAIAAADPLPMRGLGRLLLETAKLALHANALPARERKHLPSVAASWPPAFGAYLDAWRDVGATVAPGARRESCLPAVVITAAHLAPRIAELADRVVARLPPGGDGLKAAYEAICSQPAARRLTIDSMFVTCKAFPPLPGGDLAVAELVETCVYRSSFFVQSCACSHMDSYPDPSEGLAAEAADERGHLTRAALVLFAVNLLCPSVRHAQPPLPGPLRPLFVSYGAQGPKECAQCGASAPRKKCKCGEYSFCDKECYAAFWHAGHKALCAFKTSS